MTGFTKIFSAVLAAAMLLTSGCAKTETVTGGSSSDISTSLTTESDEMETTKIYTADNLNVKLLGRTTVDNGIMWLALSASGIEFTFTGTRAAVTIIGDSMCNAGKDKQARFAVYIDGERTMDTQVDSTEKVYEIFSADSEKETTVSIIKLSEAAESTFGIRSIEVDGSEIAPTPEKELKIEFVGDSITCGYGVDDEDRDHHFSTSTEDATKAYAYKTAKLLDADYSLVSYSGHGIISGYTDNPDKKSPNQLVPKLYEQFAKSYGNYDMFNVADVQWDFSQFQPDFVVVNLGTNDASYCKGDRDKMTEYATEYVEFIKLIREKNPNAHIILALGVMGTDNFPGVKMAVENYINETGDTRVSHLKLKPQDGTTGYAADWHPTEATHEIAAQTTADEIKRIMAEQG